MAHLLQRPIKALTLTVIMNIDNRCLIVAVQQDISSYRWFLCFLFYTVPPAALLDEIEAAEQEGNDDCIEGLLCGAVKQMKLNRVKPDTMLFLSLMYLAKIKPNVFATEGVIEVRFGIDYMGGRKEWLQSRTSTGILWTIMGSLIQERKALERVLRISTWMLLGMVTSFMINNLQVQPNTSGLCIVSKVKELLLLHYTGLYRNVQFTSYLYLRNYLHSS